MSSNNIINAKEAREASESNKKDDFNERLKSAFENINNAIKEGETECYFSDEIFLHDDIRLALELRGYAVGAAMISGRYYWKVSW